MCNQVAFFCKDKKRCLFVGFCVHLMSLFLLERQLCVLRPVISLFPPSPTPTPYPPLLFELQLNVSSWLGLSCHFPLPSELKKKVWCANLVGVTKNPPKQEQRRHTHMHIITGYMLKYPEVFNIYKYFIVPCRDILVTHNIYICMYF